MVTIKAPNEAYNGQIGDVVFKDGVAHTDNQAVIQYCRGAGYTVGDETAEPAAEPEPVDPREVTETKVGMPLRDAAVDPRPEDFLPPTNAGKENPHGPEVVSPEIHAAGATPIVPGPVSGDAEEQQAKETKAAERALVDQEPAGPEQPAGNASQEAWADWVIATRPELNADEVREMKRDELREQYGSH